MSIAERIQGMIDRLTACKVDAEKCDNGTKAAGPRVRKVMQLIKDDAQMVRKNVCAAKKG